MQDLAAVRLGEGIGNGESNEEHLGDTRRFVPQAIT
jgi:hypothetical protein